MKRILFVSIMCLFCAGIFAQDEGYRGYLFDNFEKGKVIYTKGGISKGDFNYDTLIERMLFITADSTVYELAEPSIINRVEIGDRIFEHVKNGLFYEQIVVGNMNLYVRRFSNLLSEGKPGAYGTKSNTVAVELIGQHASGGKFYKLRVDEDFKVKYNNSYFLKLKNKFQRFSSFDALVKLFKGHEAEIKDYVKVENLNFNNIEDIKKAVLFCSGLAGE